MRKCRRGASADSQTGTVASQPWRDLELSYVFLHPEVESVNTPQLVALGGISPRARGRRDWIEDQRRWQADWSELAYEPDEIIDLGDHRFLLLGRATGTGRGSGVVIDTDWADLVTILDGRLYREQNFLDRAEAVAAAGLGEAQWRS